MSTDTIELEMDSAPSKPAAVPGLSPLSLAIIAVRTARTRPELEAAIAPARAWPEGADKNKLRAVLAEREAQLKQAATFASPPPAQPSRPVARIEDAPTYQGSALQAKVDAWQAPALMWVDWQHYMGWTKSLAEAIRQRPFQRYQNTPTAIDPRALPSLGGRGSRQAIPVVAPNEARVVDADNAYNVRAAVNANAVVVGAREAGSGILTGWAGHGELTRGAILSALRAAGMREDYAPNPQSAHAHATAALTELTHQGRILRAERGRKVGTSGIGNFRGTPRNYSARWTVGNPTHGQVGEHMGEIVLTAALTIAGNLDLEGDEKLVTQVRAEFQRRVGNEVFAAGTVTDWLRTLLVTRFGAVRLGANWYIPSEHAWQAERLCEELAKCWGQSWILPALPVATTDQLRAGLVRGLADEARVILDELAAQRAAAQRDKRADIGPKAAATMLAKLRDVYIRARGYADMLGPNMVAKLRGQLTEAITVIEPLCDDTAQRFSMMDLA